MEVIRTWMVVAVVAFSVAACTGHKVGEKKQRMSDDFELCVNLPEGATYQLRKRSFDYEIGQLALADEKFEVYIGYQPPFDGRRWPKGKEVTNGFVVVGKERVGDVERLLLGNKRQANRGPVFVMFSAHDLRAAESLLTKNNFIVDCK